MNKNKPLLQKFIEHNRIEKLASAGKRVLLAVSGGADSVAMAYLFKEAGFTFGIAHCNFQLRGAEADGDEAFVQQLAERLTVPFYNVRFNTGQYAEEKGLSIQLAARQLRYQWFEQVRVNNQYQHIATAHHLNDNIETIVYNLVKGTGIRGLRGIPVKQGKIIRPLLFATRVQLENYLQQNTYAFRNDSSNDSDKYIRNKIRHHIIPLLKEINPALEETLGVKAQLFTELEELYLKRNARVQKQLFLKRGTDIYIPVLKLKQTTNAASVLFEYLKQYGFTFQQVEDLLQGINEPAGAQFMAGTARIIKDRRFFILTPTYSPQVDYQVINSPGNEVLIKGGKLILETVPADTKITDAKNVALIDAGVVEFPLVLRNWRAGDYFYPFGMKLKQKKLKKFLTDEKVPVNEKENVLVLESNKKIVWVVGHRIDERFKVTTNTQQVYRIKWSKG